MYRGITGCRNCGSRDYQIKQVYDGYHQKLFVIECDACRGEVIPVVNERWSAPADFYGKCEREWNRANSFTIADKARMAARRIAKAFGS